MENYIKQLKYVGGYILAVGAGCMFGVSLLGGTALLAVSAYMVYSCCDKSCKK